MAANSTPLVFYLNDQGRSKELALALLTDPEVHRAAVLDALPHLGPLALKHYEPVIRTVADRVDDVKKMMQLLAAMETTAAHPRPVSDTTKADLATAYFYRTGSSVSLTTDTAQQWRIPGTDLRMSGLQACVIARQVAMDAPTPPATPVDFKGQAG